MNRTSESLFIKLLFVFIFGVAIAYFEAAVVVYLRAIFYPDGFDFPLRAFGIDSNEKRLLLTEIGREAASLILIGSAAWLFGRNKRCRLAYFMIIFAVWDIFYYVWLKVLLDWPATVMDWDILFLIPMVWASPVLAPILISVLLLIFAGAILYFDNQGNPIKAGATDWIGFFGGAVIVIISFCIGGVHITEPDYADSFHWPLFGLGCLTAIGFFVKCLVLSKVSKDKSSPASESNP